MLLNHFETITVIFLLAPLLLVSVAISEREWIKKDGSKLFIDSTETVCFSWYEAEKKCREHGALLVSIHNKEENEFIKKEIKQLLYKTYWIGLMSLNRFDEYQWSDGTSLEYENWSEKSNYQDRLKREKCVKIETDSGKWLDGSCGEWAGVICKKSKTKPETPLPTMPPHGNCPPEWHQFGLKCYKIYQEQVSWAKAKESCRTIGKNHDLMSIHSTAENMFLTSILNNDTWIGGGSLKNEYRQGWSDNSPLDYNALQEPITGWKNICIQVLGNEHYAGMWKAISCSEERMYVCQRHIDPLIDTSSKILPPKCVNRKHELVEYRGDCYLNLKNELKTWIEAEKFCESFGAHLASIGNVFESSFLYTYLYPSSSDVWIGLRGDKGLFKWLDTWPLYYTNWMKGQPRNLPDETECVALDEETQKWKVLDCETKHEFLCKLSDEEAPEIEEFDGVCPSYINQGLDLGGHYCYSVFGSEHKADWASASETCLKYKSKLASFHSEDEMRILGPYLKNFEDAWIGLHQIYDGTYEWVDNSAYDFVWKEGVTPDGECVAMSFPTLTWRGANCTQQKPFVCSTPKILRIVREDKNDEPTGLSSGAVAGIVISVLIFLSSLAYLGYYMWKNQRLRFY